MVISSSTSTGFQSPIVDDSLSETRGVSSSSENDRGALHGRAKRLTPSESTSLPSLSEIKRQKGASYYLSIAQESLLAELKKSIADWNADEDGSEIDEKGNKYVGEWKSGKRNGIGKLTCVNGDYFEGRWRNDEFFSGKGRKTDENGNVYEGDWEYGEFNGQGTKTNANGNMYRGTWRNGVFLSGQVQLTSEEPQYVGGWKRGQPHGIGKETYKNGNCFEGIWEDGEFISGKVSLTYQGSQYDGEWRIDKPHGQGKATYENEDCFEGIWEDGQFVSGIEKRSENGLLLEVMWDGGYEVSTKRSKKYADGRIYFGCWENRKFHGQGRLTYKNENYQEGEWNKGEFVAGKIRKKDKDGNTYEGCWINGKYNGQGKLTCNNRDYKDGEWKDGQFVAGKIRETTQNGNRYEGNCENGKYNGLGKLTCKNGDYKDGEWKDGLFVSGIEGRNEGLDHYETRWSAGKPISWIIVKLYEDGSSYRGGWKDGQRFGQGKKSKNGLYYDGEWRDDQFISGQVRQTLGDGVVYEGGWENGKRYRLGKLILGSGGFEEKSSSSSSRSASPSSSFSEVDEVKRVSLEKWLSDCWKLKDEIANIVARNPLNSDGDGAATPKMSRLQQLLLKGNSIDKKKFYKKARNILKSKGRVTGCVQNTDKDGLGLKRATTLHLAYFKLDSRSSLFRFLLKHSKIDINASFGEGYRKEVQEEYHPNYKQYHFENASLLHWAVARGDIRTIQLLYKTGRLEVNQPASVILRAESLLNNVDAGENYFLGRVGLIGTNNASESSKSHRKFTTALHIAAEIGRHDIVRLLLQCRANPVIKDSDGRFYTYYLEKMKPNSRLALLDWRSSTATNQPIGVSIDPSRTFCEFQINNSNLSLTLVNHRKESLAGLFKYKAISSQILKFCDHATQRALRATGLLFKQAVKEYCELQTPFKNKTDFVCSVVDVFWASKNFKTYYCRYEGKYKDNFEDVLKAAYDVYQKIKIQGDRAFLQVFTEKYVLFTKDIRADIQPLGRIISPSSGGWTPEVNDCWILGHIHHRNDFQLLADPSFLPNFWAEREVRPTALGREIYQIWQAGYRPEKTPDCWRPGDPLFKFEGKGVLLTRKEDVTAPVDIKDAKGATRGSLESILSEIKKVVGDRFEAVEYTTGRRTFCEQNHEMTRLWKPIDGSLKVVLDCKYCESTIISPVIALQNFR